MKTNNLKITMAINAHAHNKHISVNSFEDMPVDQPLAFCHPLERADYIYFLTGKRPTKIFNDG